MHSFITARCYASVVYAVVVCLVSATRRYCVKNG